MSRYWKAINKFHFSFSCSGKEEEVPRRWIWSDLCIKNIAVSVWWGTFSTKRNCGNLLLQPLCWSQKDIKQQGGGKRTKRSIKEMMLPTWQLIPLLFSSVATRGCAWLACGMLQLVIGFMGRHICTYHHVLFNLISKHYRHVGTNLTFFPKEKRSFCSHHQPTNQLYITSITIMSCAQFLWWVYNIGTKLSNNSCTKRQILKQKSG